MQSLFAADGDPDRARDAAEWALIQLGDRAQHSSTFDPETTLVLMEIGRDVQERRRKREQ